MYGKRRRWELAALIVLGVALPAAVAQDQASQRQRMYYDVKPAVVLVWGSAHAEIEVVGPWDDYKGIEDLSEILVAGLEADASWSGSGFLISQDGYLVTNGHVVQFFHEDNEEQIQRELFYLALTPFFAAIEERWRQGIMVEQEQWGLEPGSDIGGMTEDKKIAIMQQLLPHARIELTKNLDVYTQNWHRYPAEVKEYSPPIYALEGKASVPGLTLETGKDVAILKIEGRDLPVVPIGESDQMQIGDPIHAAGYPAIATFNDYLDPESEVEASFTGGQISSLKIDVKGSRLLQFDAAVAGGNSGGPMFNDRGEVIGMTTMGAGESFNYAVPTSVIIEFVRASGVTPQAGLFNRAWKEALDNYYAGEYGASVPGFDQVLRIMPELPDAMNLRREAIVAVDAGRGSRASRPWLPWAIGGAVVVGGALVVMGLLRARRSTPAAAPAAPKPMRETRAEKAPAAAGSTVGTLVVREGPLRGNRFVVDASGTRIGRDPETCQVVLAEATVSRQHAVIEATGRNSEVVIKNLSGTNPIYVNDRAIQETTLKTGDQIKIGSSILTYTT
jgi:serine protease Do